MSTALDNLQSQYANAVARLAEIDAVPVDERWRSTYSFSGKTMDWNAYRASLQTIVDKFAIQVEAYFKAQQMIAGPFTVVGGNCGW